jgi:hypothetical protein
MGDHTKWGGYIVDWRKVRTYVAPERLDAFKVSPFAPDQFEKATINGDNCTQLTPFVTQKMEPTKKGWEGRMTGQKYINLVRDENSEELYRLLAEQEADEQSTKPAGETGDKADLVQEKKEGEGLP